MKQHVQGCQAVRWETGLQVLHGVPVVLQEDDSVSCSQVQAQPAHMGGQQQHLNGGVAVKALHNAEPLLGLHTASSNMCGMAEHDAASGSQMSAKSKGSENDTEP